MERMFLVETYGSPPFIIVLQLLSCSPQEKNISNLVLNQMMKMEEEYLMN